MSTETPLGQDWKLEGALEAFKQSRDECAVLHDKLAEAKADLSKLRMVLQEARMFVGSQALGQSRTHRADVLLKKINEALAATQDPPIVARDKRT